MRKVMNKEDQEFVREYCDRYGVEMLPGPGAPWLNGLELTGKRRRQLFLPESGEMTDETSGIL